MCDPKGHANAKISSWAESKQKNFTFYGLREEIHAYPVRPSCHVWIDGEKEIREGKEADGMEPKAF